MYQLINLLMEDIKKPELNWTVYARINIDDNIYNKKITDSICLEAQFRFENW